MGAPIKCWGRMGTMATGGALLLLMATAPAIAEPKRPDGSLPPASNPAAVDPTPGTGRLGRWLGLPADGALRLGGVWVGNGATQLNNGATIQSEQSGLAQQLLLDLTLDLQKALGWSGAKLSVQGLQLNANTGADATGSVQGANSLLAPPPLNRTELFSYTLTQKLFDNQLRIKLGKFAASTEFANVITPDAGPDGWNYWIPAISSLTYTPPYAMPTLIGRLPGYPDSALGGSISFEPKVWNRKVAFQAGIFDGRGSSGVNNQVSTGLSVPSLSGPLFAIAQISGAWSLGKENMPGNLGLGIWNQSGPLSICSTVIPTTCLTENSASGGYLIGQQRLLNFRYPNDNSGITSFLQMGITPSNTNLMTASVGGGLTMFAPFKSRPLDSYGIGLSWARMNNQSFLTNAFNPSELMMQIYGQFHIAGDTFLSPSITYLPTVGSTSSVNGSTNILLQLVTLF